MRARRSEVHGALVLGDVRTLGVDGTRHAGGLEAARGIEADGARVRVAHVQVETPVTRLARPRDHGIDQASADTAAPRLGRHPHSEQADLGRGRSVGASARNAHGTSRRQRQEGGGVLAPGERRPLLRRAVLLLLEGGAERIGVFPERPQADLADQGVVRGGDAMEVDLGVVAHRTTVRLGVGGTYHPVMDSERLTHADEAGEARMVDVGGKAVTARRALAQARVRMAPATFVLVRDGRTAKGDALAVARLAGIQGAKRTADLIPLCHPLGLDHVDVRCELEAPDAVRIIAETRVTARTGVEMEALTAAAVAALTLYDMVKGVDRTASIEGLHLLEKDGGKSGSWRRPGVGESAS